MKSIIALVLGFIPWLLLSQTISPGVLAVTGQTFSNSSFSVQWTLGEVVVDQSSNGTAQLDHGFNQLLSDEVNTAVSEIKLDVPVSLFPNPALDRIIVEIADQESYQYTIYSMTGERLAEGWIQNGIRLDIAHLVPSTYFVEFRGLRNERGIYIFTKQ